MHVDVPIQNGVVVTLRDDVLPEVASDAAALPRRCYAAAHVVMLDGYADVDPEEPDDVVHSIDWDATLALRARLDRLGFGIAEAMDTAQRFELGWRGAEELLRRTSAARFPNGFVGGASTDHVPHIADLDALGVALIEQVHRVAELGGIPVILPQPWLTEHGATEDDYVDLYVRVADAARGPIVMHWLGEAFHPAMRGYFPGDSARRVLAARPGSIIGIKLSLLDRPYEERLRAELGPRGQVVFTGDDFNFSGLIEGASQDVERNVELDGRPMGIGTFSHALLGVLDGIARPASIALARLGRGDIEGYRAIMEPCEALGQVLFEAPTRHYKAGLAFLGWLNGLQSNPMLPYHEERSRSLDHYIRVAEAASRAGVIENAELAAERLATLVRERAPEAHP